MTERDERRARWARSAAVSLDALELGATTMADRVRIDKVRTELSASQRDREALASLLKPIAVEDKDGALAVLMELAAQPDGDIHTGDDPGGCVFCHAVEIAKAFLERTESTDGI